MEKYFDAKDMRNVIDDIEWLFSGYREHSDGLIGCYEKYRDNDLFQGAVAEASKLFIGKHQITQAKAQVAMQQKLLDMYKHALTSFHEKVDKAPDARVDLETLDIVNKDFQDIYADLDEYVKYIEKVVKLLQARYGFLGIFTMPKCQPALDTFTALCGGDNPRSGFIYDLMQKFINYDADECAYADSLNFEQEIDDENDKIQAATNLLEGYQTVKPSDSTSNVTHTENSNSTAETTSGKRDEFAIVQERYGFSEEEMEYLKKNYPSLVISLYGASNYSTSDADKILQQIKEKLEKYSTNKQLYDQIKDDYVREFVMKKNLTPEQIQYIINIQNLKDHDSYVYTDQKKKDMQIVATMLFANNYSESFVAGMLGNVYAEGDFGYLEGVNKGTNTGFKYWDYINELTYVDEETGKKYTYYDDFSFKHLYEVDFQAYLELVNMDMDEHPDYANVIGCGSVQWTSRDRFKALMEYYVSADKAGNNDGQLSYEECVEAEVNYMIYELGGDYSSVVDNCGSISSEDAAANSATVICNEYERPNKDYAHLDWRQQAAKDVYNTMING